MTESVPAGIDTSDMTAVHMVFRSSLASGPEFIASAEGDDERRQLIANYYANVLDFLEVHHEGEEELVFPLLVERAPEHRALVEEVAGQHADVLAPMGALKASVSAWESDGDSEAPEVLRTLSAINAALFPHLDKEEADLLPLASVHLTAQEWGKLPAQGLMNFKGDKIWLILGLIRENFTQEQRNMMLENMPPPAREMWENMGEASFNALIAQVRQTDL